MNQPSFKEALPQELLDQLSKQGSNNLLYNLQQLFADGKQRSIDETLIDYWYQHKKVIKRTTMASALADLAKRSQTLRRCGLGVYIINTPTTGEEE